MLPLNIDPRQILLHLFNFVLLYAILSFLIYKPVKAFMAKRREHYAEMDRAAVKKLEQAERVEADYNQKLAAMDETLRAKQREQQRALDERRDELLREASIEAEQIVSAAKREAEKRCEQAMREGRDALVDYVKSSSRIWSNASTSEAFDEFLHAAERSERDGTDHA